MQVLSKHFYKYLKTYFVVQKISWKGYCTKVELLENAQPFSVESFKVVNYLCLGPVTLWTANMWTFSCHLFQTLLK